MDRKINSLAFLMFILTASLLHAQIADSTKLYRMSEVVVTATKTSIPEIETGSSISIIDSADISEKNNFTVYDLLKNQYGLSFTQQGPEGSLEDIYLRGSNPGDTKVLVDGISLNMPNDPTNSFDFSELPVDNISKVEILRGPQSTLYGSNALAGVINIITQQGYGKPKFFLSGEGGSYNTYKGMLGLSGSLDQFNYSVTASRFKSDGFPAASKIYGNKVNDGTEDYYISSRLGYTVSSDLNFNFYIKYLNKNTGLAQHGGYYGDDPTYFGKTEEADYKAEGRLLLLDGKWEQIYSASFMRNVREYAYDSNLYNPASSTSIYDGNSIKFEWQNNISLIENNLITFGAESEQENAASTYLSNSSLYGPYNSLFPQNSETAAGIFLQDQLNIGNRFFSAFGVRYDHHTRFGYAFTYRIAPDYMFWPTGTKIKASYGTAFKAPSLFDLFDPNYGNPDLKPEKSTGWDAGIEQYIWQNNLTAGINYFSTNFTDLFGDDNNFREININSAEARGYEFYLKMSPLNNMMLSVNYTITKTKDTSPGSPGYGLELIRHPEHKFGIDLNYTFLQDANFNVQALYVGKRDDEDFSFYPAQRLALGGYTVVNLSTAYPVSGLITGYGRVDNLFNKYYEEVFGFGTPGLSGYLGAKLTLKISD
jgi:vitamin B12 transporter